MVISPGANKNSCVIAAHSVGSPSKKNSVVSLTLGDSDGVFYYMIILSKPGCESRHISLVLMLLQPCIFAKVSSCFVDK